MTVSVASTTIRYSRKSGVYTTEIISPSGDLVQYYKGDEHNPGEIYLDFGKMDPKPILYLMTMSSRANEGKGGRVTHNGVDIYVNNKLLEFDSNTKLSTTIFGTKAGQFKLISSTDNENYDGIEIQENLLPYSGTPESGYAPITIKMVGHVLYGSQLDDVQGTYTIACAKVPGSAYCVTIIAGDGNNFLITSTTESSLNNCKLKAMAYDLTKDMQSAISSAELTYKWHRSDPMAESGWSEIATATSQVLTVTCKDVISYCDFKCEVYMGGVLIGSDVRSVKDATDALDIDLKPNPQDETIEEGSGGHVLYTPAVTANGVELTGYLFRFLAMDSHGVPLNKWQNGNEDELEGEMSSTAQTSFMVTEPMCQQAQGDVSLTVFAEEVKSQ